MAMLNQPAERGLMEKLRQSPRVWVISGQRHVTPPYQILPGCELEDAMRIDGIGFVYRVGFPASAKSHANRD
jgi:hypothetical protein